jgi:hypothetical protein
MWGEAEEAAAPGLEEDPPNWPAPGEMRARTQIMAAIARAEIFLKPTPDPSASSPLWVRGAVTAATSASVFIGDDIL